MTIVPMAAPGTTLPKARSRDATIVIGRITFAVAVPVAVALDCAIAPVALATKPKAMSARRDIFVKFMMNSFFDRVFDQKPQIDLPTHSRR
jgi:hypothetical protein